MEIKTATLTRHFHPRLKELGPDSFIVLHHTADQAQTVNGILNYFVRNDRKVSCHYLVDYDGSIYRVANDDDVAYHAGFGAIPGVMEDHNPNELSLGIEIRSHDGNYYTDEQRESVMELILYLKQKYGISSKNVLRHADVDPGRKWDVGPNFYSGLTWEQYQDSIEAAAGTRPSQIEIVQEWIDFDSMIWHEIEEMQKAHNVSMDKIQDLLHQKNNQLRSNV